MTYSKKVIDAYAKLDEAVDAIRAAYKEENDSDVLIGYVLLTSSIEFQEADDDDEYKDDLDTCNIGGWYSKRGQNPTLSYGIVNEALRHYNRIQVDHGE